MLKETGLCPANTTAPRWTGAAPPVPGCDVRKIRAIFLDLDDTILDFSRAEASALRRVLTEDGIPAGDAILARYHDINAAQWVLLEEGKITRPRCSSAGSTSFSTSWALPGTRRPSVSGTRSI